MARRVMPGIYKLSCGHSVEMKKDMHWCPWALAPNGKGKRKRICVPCATQREVRAMKKATRYTAYLCMKDDRAYIGNWPGEELAKVTSLWGGDHNWSHVDEVLFFNAVDKNGNHWWGRSQGFNLYCHLFRMKNPG